jgi:uncharacterized protein (DUF4415 family)
MEAEYDFSQGKRGAIDPILPGKTRLTIWLLDRETFAWFQAQGESAQQQMSVALRIYADAHKTSPAFVTKPA